MFGIEVSGRIAEETDERGTFPYHCSDFSTRSQGTAPCLTSVTSRADASTIVDGAPPRDGPASRIASTSGSAAATAAGADAAAAPDRFALVAVTQNPTSRASAI